MTRTTSKILYYSLPVALWLLAAGGIYLWALLTDHLALPFLLPAALILVVIYSLHHIPRHVVAVEPCFRMALWIGVAAYWLPTVLFLILPVWGYLFYYQLLNERSLLASLLGFVTVAIWVFVLYALSLIPLPTTFFSEHLAAWIPVCIVFVTWLLAVLARERFYVR